MGVDSESIDTDKAVTKAATTTKNLTEFQLKEKQLIQSLKKDAGKIQESSKKDQVQMIRLVDKGAKDEPKPRLLLIEKVNKDEVQERPKEEPPRVELIKIEQPAKRQETTELKIDATAVRQMIGKDGSKNQETTRVLPVQVTTTPTKRAVTRDHDKIPEEDKAHEKDDTNDVVQIKSKVQDQLERERTPDFDDLIEEEKFTPSTNSSEGASAPQTPQQAVHEAKYKQKPNTSDLSKNVQPPLSASAVPSTSSHGTNADAGRILISITNGRLSDPNGPIQLLDTKSNLSK